VEIRTVDRQETMVIRLTASASELPEVMGEAFGEVAKLMAENNVQFAGPPFALYHNMDMNALDVEMGFPVAAGAVAAGRVTVSELPAGRVASAVHTGQYSDLEKTYTALMAFVNEEGIRVHDWMYECYLNSPDEVPPDELKTEIFFPVAE